MNPRISVILPVYNTRKYLPFTLRNIIVDQFSSMRAEEWELIVIDDGSTDGSHLEIEPWIERYPSSVRLIRKTNAGVSAARNTGLDAARGHYVYFMDSDDLLLRNALPQLLTTEADIVKFHFRMISSEEYDKLKLNVPTADFTLPEATSTTNFLNATNGMHNGKNHVATVVSLYRREFLTKHSLKYDTNFANGEDELFIWNCMLHRPAIAYTDTEIYLYNQRVNSASNKIERPKLSDYFAERIRFTGRMIPLLKRLGNNNILDSKLYNYVKSRYHYFYQLYVVEMIVKGLSLRKLFGAMLYYKNCGGDVHPGRPRFSPYYQSAALPLIAKLRRWIIAYPAASIIALI